MSTIRSGRRASRQSAAAAFFFAVAAHAAEGHAHVHGAAELRIVVDGAQLEVALETPLDNLLGFEHAPRTASERAAVRAMAARLRQPSTLFMPTPAARCIAGSVEIDAPVLPAELLGNPTSAGAAPSTPGETHADLDATFRWQCDAPSGLKGLEVALLEAFPGLRTVKVQIAGLRGQSATVLSGTRRSLRW